MDGAGPLHTTDPVRDYVSEKCRRGLPWPLREQKETDEGPRHVTGLSPVRKHGQFVLVGHKGQVLLVVCRGGSKSNGLTFARPIPK